MAREKVKTIENDLEFLRQISKEVDLNDKDLNNDIELITRFCKENEVMAMASVQLGVPKRIIYLKNTDLDRINNSVTGEIDDYDEARILINPVIKKREGLTSYLEACASCMDNAGVVKRPYRIYLEYLDIKGNKHDEIFEGFEATVLSHEYDHLNGILHIDVADEIMVLNVEERKEYRLTHPYKVFFKNGIYEELKFH